MGYTLNHLGRSVGHIIPNWSAASSSEKRPLEARYCLFELLEVGRTPSREPISPLFIVYTYYPLPHDADTPCSSASDINYPVP